MLISAPELELLEVKNPPEPETVFPSFLSDPCPFFLDSALNDNRLGRYSFIGSRPFLILRSSGKKVVIKEGSSVRYYSASPFGLLRELLRKWRIERTEKPVPFVGGAVGYFGYELCHFVEKLPASVDPAASDRPRIRMVA